MMKLRSALVILGLGCATALGCGTDLIDDILGGHGHSGGGGSVDGGMGGGVLHCGGNTTKPATCPAGMDCVPDPANPLPFGDVGGICVKSPPQQFCGGIATRPCPGGGKCVDDPSDSCDPTKGGADCGGICRCVQNVACINGALFDNSPQVCACVLPSPPPPPACGPVCQIFCEFGNVLDAKGCPTCSCNPPPPPPSPPVCGPVCQIFCEFGNVLDAKGCPTCSCNPPPPPPPACGPVCQIFCEFGNVLDAKGCPTCSCNPPPSPPPACGPVCDIYCQFGNVLDAKGCPTCRCNPAPVPAIVCPAEKCAGPGPKAASFSCPDGHSVAGPACVVGPQGSCGWTVLPCPAAK